MEQIEGPMNIVASSSVHVNLCVCVGGGLRGRGSRELPPPGVVRGSYVYFAGIYHDGIDLSKIAQTASKIF